jgi:hypothetical protein
MPEASFIPEKARRHRRPPIFEAIMAGGQGWAQRGKLPVLCACACETATMGDLTLAKSVGGL